MMIGNMFYIHPPWNSQSCKDVRNNVSALNQIGMEINAAKNKYSSDKTIFLCSDGCEKLSAYLKRLMEIL